MKVYLRGIAISYTRIKTHDADEARKHRAENPKLRLLQLLSTTLIDRVALRLRKNQGVALLQ